MQESVSAIFISWWKYKVCIFQTRIGILDYTSNILDYQSLCKLDFLQIVRESLFSPKNRNLKNDYIIWDLAKGLILERKLAWVKIFNTITQLGEHDSLRSLSQKTFNNDFLSCVTMHLPHLPQKSLRHCRILYDTSLSFCVMSCLNIVLCEVM